jgi:hypothetical protein
LVGESALFGELLRLGVFPKLCKASKEFLVATLEAKADAAAAVIDAWCFLFGIRKPWG